MMRDVIGAVVRVMFFGFLTLVTPVLFLAASFQMRYVWNGAPDGGSVVTGLVIGILFGVLGLWGLVVGPSCLPRIWFLIVAIGSTVFGVISWDVAVSAGQFVPVAGVLFLVHSLWACYIYFRSAPASS
ncbi:MAG: hypothetical protein IT405_03315 [Candidatus Yanofskybacteria bacterium]|nr:hypothetical protein [Candidatus Yanofskybacteria bacterium]